MSWKGEDRGYRTIRFICISEKQAEQRLIPGNRRKESGADMRGNIQGVQFTETGIEPQKKHPYVIIWLDDASRMAIAWGVFKSSTHVESIETFKEAQNKTHEFNVRIRAVNIDRDLRFFSNKNPGASAFEYYLKGEEIRPIPSRKGNPQTNGKLERLWLEYDRYRWRFESIEAFLKWYNNRIHGALEYFIAETPQEAFLRRSQPEAFLGRFLKWGDWYEKKWIWQAKKYPYSTV